MASFNKVIVMGNLTKDPELRYTAGGLPVANLRMAINNTYKSKSGDQKEDVCFLTVVVWDKQAENCGQYLLKGSPVLVEGRLQSRNWETDDGQKRSTIEVVATSVQFLSKGKGNTAQEEALAPSDQDKAALAENTSAGVEGAEVPF